MKKLLLTLCLSLGFGGAQAQDLPDVLGDDPFNPRSGTAADADLLDFDYEDILDNVGEGEILRTERGIIRNIDLQKRTMVISGFLYHAPPIVFEYPLEVSLYGTTAGSFELLQVGMKVEVEFIDVQGLARAAFTVTELADGVDVEH